MVEIGKPEEVPEIEVQPLENPLPHETPAPAPVEPVRTPELVPA